MTEYTIKYDRGKCIGAGSCVQMAPETWELDGEARAVLKKEKISEEELKKNVNAAKSCPTSAIEIFDQDGKKVV